MGGEDSDAWTRRHRRRAGRVVNLGNERPPPEEKLPNDRQFLREGSMNASPPQ